MTIENYNSDLAELLDEKTNVWSCKGNDFWWKSLEWKKY